MYFTLCLSTGNIMNWKLVLSIAQLIVTASGFAFPDPVRVYDPQMTPANYDIHGSSQSQSSVQPYLQPNVIPTGSSNNQPAYTQISNRNTDYTHSTSPSLQLSKLFKPSSFSLGYAPNQAYSYIKTVAKYIAPSQFSKPESLYSGFTSTDIGSSKDHYNSQYDGYNGYNAEVQPVTYNKHSGIKTFETNAGKEELNDGSVAFYKNPLGTSHSSVGAVKMFDMHPAFKDAMNIDGYYDMSTLALPKGFGESFYGHH